MLLPKNESTSLKCLLEAFDLTITNNHYPTRTRVNTATCLDVLFSDFEWNIHVQDYNVSDNRLVNFKMPTSLPMKTENGFRRRNWKKLEREDFKLFFNYNLNIALNDQKQNFHPTELNSAFSLINSVLETALDTFLPLKFNKANIKHIDWIENDVKKATN